MSETAIIITLYSTYRLCSTIKSDDATIPIDDQNDENRSDKSTMWLGSKTWKFIVIQKEIHKEIFIDKSTFNMKLDHNSKLSKGEEKKAKFKLTNNKSIQ